MTEAKHNTDALRRRIRSFVRREGRLTAGQQKALETLWLRYGLSIEHELKLTELFGRSAPVTLEIGFGNGASLAEMAEKEPDSDFIGIDVHRPGVGHLLKKLEEQGLDNVRVFCHDAVEILERNIPDAGLHRVLL
ncbi:MAG: methyltransferase domain-containing protein, partial [Thiogranum sp.]